MVIISGLFTVLYGLGLYFWNKKVTWRIGDKSSQWIRYVHYLLLLLTAVSAVLEFTYDTSFAGRWTTRIIIIGFLLSGTFIYPISRWIVKLTFEKLYFRLFSFFPMIASAFLMIPFLGVVIVFSSFFKLVSPPEKIFYEDDNLRVQSTFSGVLAPPMLDIVEKRGLFEKRLHRPRQSALDIDSIDVERRPDETLIILYNTRYEPGEEVEIDTVKLPLIKTRG